MRSMGTTFFIILILAEAALAVLTFSRFKEKASWLRNRTLTTAAETAVFLLIILLPTTALKWRFAAAVILLAVRLLFEAVRWAVRRKKVQGEKSKAAAVASGVLSVVFIGLALVPSFIFANYSGIENTGSFEVKTCSAILVDKNRQDTFENDGSFREVPTHFFYPDGDGSFPLVVFSHGAFGYYESNYSTFTELASHGYIVASLDHPHHAFFTTDTSGSTVIVDSNFINTAISVTNGEVEDNNELFKITSQWMELRTDDENFVLDTIKDAVSSGSLSDAWHTDNEAQILSVLAMTNTDKIGLIGHSMGGATSVAAGRERDDIDAVIVLDGTMLTEVVSVNGSQEEYYEEPYPVPILDFTKEKDYNERMQAKLESSDLYVNDVVIEHAKDGRTVVFKNAEHMDFTDLPMFSPFLAKMLGSSDIDHEQFMKTVNGVVLNWFDYYLKGEGSPDIAETY